MKKPLLSLLFLAFCTTLFAQVSTQEKQALIDFYNATNGEQWNSTWELNQPVSEWQGVTLENDKVIGITLLFNNLEGTIPSSIENLTSLETLELSFNKISGELPTTMGNLSNLKVLAFNGNHLTGTIPSTIGNLTQLKQLHLSSNNITGNIPVTIKNLKALEIFNVFDNQLTGVLPTDLAQNNNLKELMVAENKFTNPEMFSMVLLSNSGALLDLTKEPTITSPANSIIAIETSDDE
ncbi:leucine-rich repeat domain-containing protein [Marixanthomonas ophiurae]|uniref:Two component regulator three Y domain protein n=1 Tax=Marixanthomonas ophiurae TaxID=387659 RepID=A0A3E1Q741_9FLAO|nr:Two component regulator three Y domain protein [Marixanthomonas ophiurae]RFN57930.1 Two component regulator three Y domain protein [Marixanthomonas ophiurae]